MKKVFLASFIVLLVLVASAIVINSYKSEKSFSQELILTNSSSSEQVKPNQTSSQNFSASNSGKINLATLELHSSSSDCWVVYKNKVYDITMFIPQHPGGEGPIARTCGTTNFESAFQRQHGTSKASMFMKVTTYKGDFVI